MAACPASHSGINFEAQAARWNRRLHIPGRHQVEPLADTNRGPRIAGRLLPIGGLFLAKLRRKFGETFQYGYSIFTGLKEGPRPIVLFRNACSSTFVQLRDEHIFA